MSTRLGTDLDVVLDEFLEPIQAVCRCDRCHRLKLSAFEGEECGPDFARDTLCMGVLQPIEDPPQDVLMAAYKLGGTRAAFQLVLDGCNACVDQHLVFGRRCILHRLIAK